MWQSTTQRYKDKNEQKKMKTILMSINKRLVRNILCGLQIIKFYTYIKKDDIFLKTSILLNEKSDLQITLHT